MKTARLDGQGAWYRGTGATNQAKEAEMLHHIAINVGVGRMACYVAIAVVTLGGFGASAEGFVAGVLVTWAAHALDEWGF